MGVRAIWSTGVMGWPVLLPAEYEWRMKDAEEMMYAGLKLQGELKGDADVDGTGGGGMES